MIPTIGIRVESIQSGKVVVYTSDTEPCPAVLNLGKDADLLIHEATGEGFGHSSAVQAGKIAREAGAKKLMLIHFIADKNQTETMLSDTRQVFGGEVIVADELLSLEF